MFHHNSHFAIGKDHLNNGKPCQDYALSGSLPDGACYAVVSDGCSSGGKTDIGARVVSLTTARAFKSLSSTSSKAGAIPVEIRTLQKIGIENASTLFGLTNNDMLATCIYCYVDSRGGFFGIQGDGVIAYKLSSGIIHMYRYDWENNEPFYPAYMLGRLDNFVKRHGGDLCSTPLSYDYWEYDPEIGKDNPKLGFSVVEENVKITLAQGIETVMVPIPKADDIAFVAVFSDGVTRVDQVDWKTAVVELLAFKTEPGDFAIRRMNGFLKEAAKLGKGPGDDIAYAVLHLLAKEEL